MKIAFVGAFGYGNIGDDTYPLVFQTLLPGHELHFFNSDIPKSLPSGIEMLVLGGGGILHNVGKNRDSEMSHHFVCMRHYMEFAIQRQIPLGFLSCGFQFRAGGEPNYREALQPWASYMARARFVALRSRRCVEIARELTERSDIVFLPDAAYLFSPADAATGKPEDILTVVPAGAVNPSDRLTQKVIRNFQSMAYRIVWLSLGARADDAQNLQTAARLYPAAQIESPSRPGAAFERIARSRMVLSGRYHGMIFARKSRIPFLTPESAPYKLLNENLEASLPTLQDYRAFLRPFVGA